jgi:hypothetical protein
MQFLAEKLTISTQIAAKVFYRQVVKSQKIVITTLIPRVNPTIVIYNASDSLARFDNKKYFILL